MPNEPVQCYGPEASRHTKTRLCGDESGRNYAGVEVQLEIAPRRDRYGRLLAYLWQEEEQLHIASTSSISVLLRLSKFWYNLYRNCSRRLCQKSKLTIVGGFLFGPLWGVTYTVVAANLSAMAAYLAGRYFGQGVLREEATGGLVNNYANRMRHNSFETVLIMRLIFLPYDLVNYLAGFLRIDWKAFLLATALGSIPATISIVVLGAAASPAEIEQFFRAGTLPSLDGRILAISVGMFLVSLALSRYFKRRERQP